MEGVGARLGRSSTRYGPATVFTGPVRKWKKKWVHVTPPNGASSNHHHHHHNSATTNGNANGNNGSHLLLYKWTPITQSQNNNSNNNGGSAKNEATPAEEPLKRKFKYVPIAVLEELKDEAAEQVDVEVEDEPRPSETDPEAAEPNSKTDGFDEKPDINDVPMEENQATDDNPLGRQDLNESTLDLSLGLKSHDGENDSDLRTDQTKDG